jgi:hypothetical protein
MQGQSKLRLGSRVAALLAAFMLFTNQSAEAAVGSIINTDPLKWILSCDIQPFCHGNSTQTGIALFEFDEVTQEDLLDGEDVDDFASSVVMTVTVTNTSPGVNDHGNSANANPQLLTNLAFELPSTFGPGFDQTDLDGVNSVEVTGMSHFTAAGTGSWSGAFASETSTMEGFGPFDICIQESDHDQTANCQSVSGANKGHDKVHENEPVYGLESGETAIFTMILATTVDISTLRYTDRTNHPEFEGADAFRGIFGETVIHNFENQGNSGDTNKGPGVCAKFHGHTVCGKLANQIPEPSSLAILGIGFASFFAGGLYRRRKMAA